MKEKFCPIHGPYDASLPECPYCAAERANAPPPPQPLEEASQEYFAPDLASEDATEYEAFEDVEHTVVLSPERREASKHLLGLLWVKSGAEVGAVYRIKDGAVVGRSQGDVLLQDPAVSNPHARFTVEDERFVVWDFGSTNGTLVNGERVRGNKALAENDEIQFGKTVLILKTMHLGEVDDG